MILCVPTDTAELFRVLMHPTRIAMLDLLRGGEQCVCHLEATLGRRQAYVSQQLTVLREAGLVADRREGLNIFYQVIRPEVFAVLDAARSMTGEPAQISLAPGPRPCPCPKCSSPAAP